MGCRRCHRDPWLRVGQSAESAGISGPDSAYPAPVEIGVTLIEQLGDATVIDLGSEAHNTGRTRYVVASADIVH